MKWLIAAAATVALGVYLGRRVAAAEAVPDDMPDQLPNAIESFANDLIQMPYLLPNVSVNEAQNLRAFLDMIAFAEGTAGENGYYVMFGGGLMTSLADHPRRLFTFTNLAGQQLRTTAAGRYQFLARTWDTLKARLGLPDFGPASQDAAAIELIRERGALPDVYAGRLTTAITKVATIWASLPGAGYNQPERKLTSLATAYQAAGGNFEA